MEPAVSPVQAVLQTRPGITEAEGSPQWTPSTLGVKADSQRDVVIMEVGPRDGLQNEPLPIPTDRKIAFIDALSAAGLPAIEATSFVNPKAVPQLADAAEVMLRIERKPGVVYPVLIPNAMGMERALEAHVDAIALFTSATEAFALANVGATIAGTFDRFSPVVQVARERGMWLRGYVSVAFGCPYSGPVSPSEVSAVAERLLELGCDEVCLADTIGVGTPETMRQVLGATLHLVPAERLALHLHDTGGLAIVNVEVALSLGIRTFDSAAGGLGGCPFAPGAPGNLATEKLVGRMNELGLRTGVDADAVRAAAADLTPFVPKLGALMS